MSLTLEDTKVPSDAIGVAPETAEETGESVFDVSATDIAEAANASTSFIESLTTSEDDDETEPLEEEEEEEIVEEEEVQEEEVEDEEDDEPIETEDEPKGDSHGVKKRIGKLVERAKKAEAEAEALRGELDKKQGEPQQDNSTPGSDRFESVTNPEKLDKMEADAEHLREWLIQNPEGGEYQDRTGGNYDVDYETAKQLHVQTDRDLRKNIPQKRGILSDRVNAFQQANQRFKWMQDNGSQEYVEMAGILQNNKFAKRFYESDPNAVLLFGYAVEGWKSHHKPKKGKAKVEQAPTSIPTSSRTKRATKNTSSNAKAGKLKKMALTSGNHSDVRSYLESIL